MIYELCFNSELSPKVVANAFWRGEVEDELRRTGMIDFKFKLDSDYDKWGSSLKAICMAACILVMECIVRS